MAQINVAIVDDEQNSIDSFYRLTQNKCPNVDILFGCSNPDTFLNNYQNHLTNIDILFLNIAMKPISGLELLHKLQKNNKCLGFEFVFLTTYDGFTTEALKFRALDYLLKPLVEDKLVETLHKWRSSKNKEIDFLIKNYFEGPIKKDNRIAIPTFDGYEILVVEDIIRCEAERNYSKIKYLKNNKEYLVSRNLKELIMLQENHGFLRIHNSHLINPFFIKKILKTDGGMIEMSDGKRIRITKNKEIILELLFKQIPKI
ncbi:LytR/AlgR family response regulator transcription factor [Aquiflexum sp.]|uniref:LytR/AlgR family response regulator transcription factor n=1 Tax=Aquiflexum sp. TaxID=1872584 RepID=UPI0035932DC4